MTATQMSIPGVGRIRDNIFLRNDYQIRSSSNPNRRSYAGSTALSSSKSANEFPRSSNIDKPCRNTYLKQSISSNGIVNQQANSPLLRVLNLVPILGKM
ncbi:unnamed protein product [Bursaphelenchus xylophilus]|uniref:(pine wood nematode) hypothetical protein n=1 Tax=Bursaphelenchus xylophilus TaxID=6326 RepID=A0A1I7SB51_BURXY|nr:unnamed protein product [Bursaphelenchus xylophilus]CAG9131749.1 unnamed protein product [Bursaphelenchus xylophilus]